MQYEIALTLTPKGEEAYPACVADYLSFSGCEDCKPQFIKFWSQPDYIATASCGSKIRYWNADFDMNTDSIRGILLSATEYLETDDYLYLEVGHNEEDGEFIRNGAYWESPFEPNFIRGIYFRKVGEHYVKKPNRPVRFPRRGSQTRKMVGLMRRKVAG